MCARRESEGMGLSSNTARYDEVSRVAEDTSAKMPRRGPPPSQAGEGAEADLSLLPSHTTPWPAGCFEIRARERDANRRDDQAT